MKNVIFFICLIPFFTTAQVNIQGVVKHQNNPIDFANVELRDTTNEFITGVVTDNGGQFELSLNDGAYIIVVTHLNYENKDTIIQISNGVLIPNNDLLQIDLYNNAHHLNEVVITASKKIIRREIDRTVLDVSGNVMLASGNAHEAMQFAPGLAVNNESIVMLGKSDVRIAIDGRILQLSGDELNAYLRSMPASEIKAIEIITNPPARYEAEGNSGIVNIVTKRLKQDVWHNTVSMSHSQARLGWQNFNNNFNFRKNKLSLTSNLSVQTGRQEYLQFVEPEYSNNPQKITSVQDRNVTSIAPRFIVDYKMNDKTTVGVQYLNQIYRVRQLDDLETTIFNDEGQVSHFLKADDVEVFEDEVNASYNFYFDRQLDTTGGRLIFNLDILDYNGKAKTELFSNRFDSNRNFESIDFANRGDTQYGVSNYSASLDMEHNIASLKFSYGVSSNLTRTDYSLKNYDLSSDEPVFRPEDSNNFKFKENILATYMSAYKKIGTKWEIQTGLRAEYSMINGNSDGDSDINNNLNSNYLKFFPTFFLSYNPNENHTFAFNYGKRISRPTYRQLNPYRTFLSGQSSQEGNPFLKPSFTHNIELTHTFRNNLHTTITLRQTQDVYSFIFDLNDETQEQLITYRNLFDEQALSITSNYEFSIAKRWTAQAFIYYGIGASNKLREEDQIQLKNTGRFYASLNNQIHLNKAKTFTANCNFWFDSPYSQSIYSFGEAYSLNLSITAKDLVKGLTVTLGAHDIFNSSPRDVTSNINSVNHRFKAYPSNRYVRLYLSYKLGNKNINNRNRNFGNENIRRRSN